MNRLRTVFHTTVILTTALALVLSASAPEAGAAVRAAAKGEREPAPPDPAVVAMLGSAVPAGRVEWLSSLLRAASVPAADGGGAAADLPLFTALRPSADGSRYEAAGLAVDLAPVNFPRLRIEAAHVVLAPAADGKSCHFELSGTALSGAARLEASGTVEWAAGPAGGDKLEATWRLDDAPVEALRAQLPGRIDPSVSGSMRIAGKASGVVAEVSTEDAPATPLRGDIQITSDWQILGRTAPATVDTRFSVDDRMVRISDGRLSWLDFSLALSGWFEPLPNGKYDMTGRFAGVDTKKVATDWNVPEAWRPASILSGAFNLVGSPGKSILRYQAEAPVITVPGLGGYDIKVEPAKFSGNILAINTDISASFLAPHVYVGGIDLPGVPIGMQWWHGMLSVGTQNTPLWGGTNQSILSYKPAEHPAFLFNSKVTGASPRQVMGATVPWLGLDADGSAAFTSSLGQDKDRKPIFTVHTSLVGGRIGGIDFFPRVLGELAKAAPGLDVKAAASQVPPPRKGTGSGTRVDSLFVESERNGDGYDLGGMVMRAGHFQLEGHGSLSPSAGLAIDGTVILPAEATATLKASAPWLASLMTGGDQMVIPVVISGKPAAPKVALAPAYRDLVERARKGEAVNAPLMPQAKHVGADNLATIPGDPAYIAPED